MFAGSFIKCGRPQCGKDGYHFPFPEAHLSSHYSIDCHLHVKVSLTLALSWWGAGAGCGWIGWVVSSNLLYKLLSFVKEYFVAMVTFISLPNTMDLPL